MVFGVNYVGDFEWVIDAGTFSPDATIQHTFADVFSGNAYLGPKPKVCAVRVVRFRDGSMWQAPFARPPSRDLARVRAFSLGFAIGTVIDWPSVARRIYAKPPL